MHPTCLDHPALLPPHGNAVCGPMADPLPPLLTYCEGGDLEAAKAELQATTAGCTVPVDDRRAPKPFVWIRGWNMFELFLVSNIT